jgi:hypothetical protein
MLGYGCYQTNRRKGAESGVALGVRYSYKEMEDRERSGKTWDVLSHDAVHVASEAMAYHPVRAP